MPSHMRRSPEGVGPGFQPLCFPIGHTHINLWVLLFLQMFLAFFLDPAATQLHQNGSLFHAPRHPPAPQCLPLSVGLRHISFEPASGFSLGPLLARNRFFPFSQCFAPSSARLEPRTFLRRINPFWGWVSRAVCFSPFPPEYLLLVCTRLIHFSQPPKIPFPVAVIHPHKTPDWAPNPITHSHRNSVVQIPFTRPSFNVEHFSSSIPALVVHPRFWKFPASPPTL